jgi:small-conductance mechanosensitive channel
MIEAIPVIKKLIGIKLPLKSSYAVFRIAKEIEQHKEFFMEEEKKLIEKYKGAINETGRITFENPENIEPFINIEEYQESSLKLILKVWCDNKKYWNLYYFLQEEVKKQFEKYNIKVPYNKIKIIE